MAYVDLNPVRAAMAPSPEQSEYTSIKERINPTLNLSESITSLIQTQQINHFAVSLKPLLAFDGNVTINQQQGILFSLNDYLELVDLTGRIIRDDKRGAIATELPPILERLAIDRNTWLNNATAFEQVYNKRFAKKRRRDKTAA